MKPPINGSNQSIFKRITFISQSLSVHFFLLRCIITMANASIASRHCHSPRKAYQFAVHAVTSDNYAPTDSVTTNATVDTNHVDWEALYRRQALMLKDAQRQLADVRRAVLCSDFKALGIIAPADYLTRTKCVSCMENVADVVLGCGHVVFCEACFTLGTQHAPQEMKCPCCRHNFVPITTQRIWM